MGLIQKLLSIAQVAGGVVLYLLIALSVLSIGMILERWWFFRRRRIDAEALGADILRRLDAGDHDGISKLLGASRSVEAEVLAAAMKWYDAGPESFQEVLQGVLRQRRKKLEGGLLFLGTLGNNAPFIGLFGTVLGIVTAFHELGAGAGATSGAMGNVMSAIAEALVATAVGILVALPAVIAYNTFQKKAGQIEENVGSLGNLVVAQMKATDGRANHASRRRERELRAVAPEVEA
ncbi:MAG TPA: MotA/TolQ/ExbB proton channel family protein [Polyangia bacterium]|nr:MotA/TolQ/ExbB proton channel family protein [Polyangia bacterium]